MKFEVAHYNPNIHTFVYACVPYIPAYSKPNFLIPISYPPLSLYIYGHETSHVMKDFIFMLSMLNCDELCYYMKILIYKKCPNEIFIYL